MAEGGCRVRRCADLVVSGNGRVRTCFESVMVESSFATERRLYQVKLIYKHLECDVPIADLAAYNVCRTAF